MLVQSDIFGILVVFVNKEDKENPLKKLYKKSVFVYQNNNKYQLYHDLYMNKSFVNTCMISILFSMNIYDDDIEYMICLNIVHIQLFLLICCV